MSGVSSLITLDELRAAHVDLAQLGLDWIGKHGAGAAARLSELERAEMPERVAIAQALRLTATPALRRRVTIGGVLGARSPRADLAVALAAHDARARVMDGPTGTVAWRPVLDVWRLHPASAILEVDFGEVGQSRFARFTGHHRAEPSLVSVAAMIRPDGAARVCVGAALPTPRVVDPARLPHAPELVADHGASKHFRHRIMRTLVSRVLDELMRK